MSQHMCSWPGCGVPVDDALWGCKPHWRRIPGHLKARVWQHYRPGQTVTTASPQYLRVYVEIETWIKANGGGSGPGTAA